MSKPGYITLSTSSGSGDGSSNVQCAAHTGRQPRSGSMAVHTANNGIIVNVGIDQSAKALFASTDQANYTKGNSSTSFNIVVTTNAKSLAVSVPSNSAVTIQSITKGGQSGTVASNGKSANIAPTGDPGKDNEYTVTIGIQLAANSDISSRTIVFTATASGDSGQSDVSTTANIIQDGASATLKVKYNGTYFQPDGNLTELTFDNAGGSKTITIESNTNWVIE